MTVVDDPLRDGLLERIGQPMSASGPALAPDPVNVPMIRHWVDALDDRNPVYLDPDAAARSQFGAVVAPPAMLQTWTMARPRIEGIAARGGAADTVDPGSPVSVLAAAGFPGTLATNSRLEFERYLRINDHVASTTALEAISELKGTALGVGYFVTWVNTYAVGDEVVGRQHFRIFKFDPTRSVADLPPRPRPARPESPRSDEAPASAAGVELPPFALDVTTTVIVAGAIASRDFMPAHHDRDYAQGQGAPDMFMNILTTNGYVARYVTDWAGPDARLRSIDIRLGAPAVPGRVLHFTGHVAGEQPDGDGRRLDVAVRAVNDLGDHATGTVTLSTR